jgi:hypothetical protein
MMQVILKSTSIAGQIQSTYVVIATAYVNNSHCSTVAAIRMFHCV